LASILLTIAQMRLKILRRSVSQEESQNRLMPTKQNPEENNVYLGKNSFFEGKLTLEGVFRLDGKVQGEIFHKGTLIMSETAVVKGKVEVSALILNGTLEGEVNAKERIEIHSRGQLFGTIATPVLVVQDGGVFEGTCKMGKKAGDETIREASENRLPEASTFDS
jgi:cytoskeletal protein CcmA (bactofilin family)